MLASWIVLYLASTPVPGVAQGPVPGSANADRFATPFAVAAQGPAAELPPPSWAAQDPADGLYRQAREALSENEWRRAATLFGRIAERYPRSTYAADAPYWEAFALYRLGGTGNLERAAARLDAQRQAAPGARTRRDADALATRIRGELAQRGDARSAAQVQRQAEAAVSPRGRNGDQDARLAALNALLLADAEQAVPILRRVLERRDPGSEVLRRQAVFLISRKRTADTESILQQVARTDPDAEVRQQAVFWLSRVPSERSREILGEILRESNDPKTRESAIFALSQQKDPRAAQMLRGVAEDRTAPRQLREQAIFWLGKRGSDENAAYLRELFERIDDDKLRDNILFAMSRIREPASQRFLLDVAGDARRSAEVRKQALFWAGENGGVSIAELAALYDRTADRETRGQVIFALSRRSEPAAFDQLARIARGDRDPKLREQAIFWISKSKDPRAASFLGDLIER